jgi:hypothetical protein
MTRVLLLMALAALLAASAAHARKPVIAYVDQGTNKLKLYDAETGTDVAAPDLTIPKINNVAPRFSMSHDGRYVAWVDNGTPKHIHLYDRESASEVALPEIDVYLNPHRLTVSNTGRIGFDDNDDGPVRVYDSRTGAFVDTGLAADNEHSRPRLSGDGRILASICERGTSKCAAPDDGGQDQDAFVQDLASRTDTEFPDDISGEAGSTETRPCIDADGSIVGGHTTVGADNQDIYLYDRAASQVITPVALRNAAVKEVNCVLDADGAYVGLGDFDGNFRVYERSSATFLNLPDGVETNEDYGLRWLTAPYPPPVDTPPPSGGGDPLPDTVAPLFEGPVTVTNRVFRVGARAAARRRPRGTAFRYTLSEAAQLGVVVERRATGRRSGRRCRPASRRLRKRPRCVRWLPRGTFAAPAVAGQNSTPFSGRIGRRALKPGRYRARLAATDAAGNRSAERRVAFRVVRR